MTAELGMHYLNVDRDEHQNKLFIANTYDCRMFILDWFSNNAHKLKRYYDGMFLPTDNVDELLQVIGIDSIAYVPRPKKRSKPVHKNHNKRIRIRSEFPAELAYKPFQVFCYSSEIEMIQELVDDLCERFLFSEEESFPKNDSSTLIISNDSNDVNQLLSCEEYLSKLDSTIEHLDTIYEILPQACYQAISAIEKRAAKQFDIMSEEDIRQYSAELVLEKISINDLEDVVKRYRCSTLTTWWILSNGKHVVSGVRDIMENPFFVLISLSHTKEDTKEENKQLTDILQQDRMLLGYVSSYIQGLLDVLSSISISYDDFLYDLYSSRIWEYFAFHGKAYARSGNYEILSDAIKDQIGYTISDRTLEDVVKDMHSELLNSRGI